MVDKPIPRAVLTLAYGFQVSPSNCALKLCEVASGETWNLTEPVLWGHAPSFDPEGNYLYLVYAFYGYLPAPLPA